MSCREGDLQIAIEMRMQLNTETKLFSPAPNRSNGAPNTNISAFCTGQPGALPALNEEAIRKAVAFGCAINAAIAKWSQFDRKVFFCPESPKNFQVTQFFHPLSRGGKIITDISGHERVFAIQSVCLEEGLATLQPMQGGKALDYNTSGIPLLKIISEPCLRNSEEAFAFCQAIHAIAQYVGICDDSQGSAVPVDVEVLLSTKNDKPCSRIRFSHIQVGSLKDALTVEINRHIQTRLQALPQKLHADLHEKREAKGDLYFPELDLPPLSLSDSFIEEIRQNLPELPIQRARRFIHDLGLPETQAFLLAYDKPLGDYFEETLKYCGNPRLLSNWVLHEFTHLLGGKSVVQAKLSPFGMAELVSLIDEGLSLSVANELAKEIILNPAASPKAILANKIQEA